MHTRLAKLPEGLAHLLRRYSPRQRWVGALLLLITLSGAYLRFTKLDYQDFWHDETATALQVGLGSLDAMFAALVADGQAPLSFVLERAAAHWLGFGKWALRFPSALAGTLSIPAMYLVGRRWFGPREGLLGAGLLAALRFPVYYSQEARPYAWLLLFSLLSIYYWLDLLRARRAGAALPRRSAALYLAFGLLAAYTHYFAFLTLLWQGVLLLLAAPRRAAGTLALLLAFIPGYLLWLPQMLGQLAGGQAHQHIPRPNTGTLIFHYRILFNDAWYRTSDWLPQAVAGGCILLALVWALGAAWAALRRGDRAAALWLGETQLLVAGGLPVAVAFAFSLFVQPLYVPRYLIAVVVPAILLVARGLTASPWRRAVPALAVALLAFFVFDLTVRLDYYNQPSKAQIEHVVDDLLAASRREPGTLRLGCLSTPNDLYFSRLHGIPDLIQAQLCTLTDLPNLEAALAAHPDATHLALARSVLNLNPDVPSALAERFCLLEANFYYWSDFHFYDLQPCP